MKKEPDYLDTVSPHEPVRWFFKIVFWIMQALHGGSKKVEKLDDFCWKCIHWHKMADGSAACRQSWETRNEKDTATSLLCDQFKRKKPRKMA